VVLFFQRDEAFGRGLLEDWSYSEPLSAEAIYNATNFLPTKHSAKTIEPNSTIATKTHTITNNTSKHKESFPVSDSPTTPTELLLHRCNWINDIDTSTAPFGCGLRKCAFRSKANPQSIGYLLSTNEYSDAIKTVTYANRLTKEFGIRHTYLAEPQSTAVNSNNANSNAPFLCNNVNDDPRNHQPLGEDFANELNNARSPNPYLKTFKAHHHLVLQPISIYPSGSVLFKCSTKILKKAQKEVKGWPRFVSTTAFEHFEAKLRSDLDTTLQLLQSKLGKCLHNDFQLVMDTEGGILHIDLDRCFERQNKKDKANNHKCTQKLVDFVDSLIDKRRPKTNST